MKTDSLESLLAESSPKLVIQGKVTPSENDEVERAVERLKARGLNTNKSRFIRAAVVSAARGVNDSAD